MTQPTSTTTESPRNFWEKPWRNIPESYYVADKFIMKKPVFMGFFVVLVANVSLT